MSKPTVIWKGTETEARELAEALTRNCECQRTEAGTRQGPACPGHKMLIEDQQAVDDLLFARYRAQCMLREEGIEAP